MPGWHGKITPSNPEGGNLTDRLDAVWTFLRLRLSQHLQVESSIGPHCMLCRLGSAADNRLNTPCTHGRGEGEVDPEGNAVENAAAQTNVVELPVECTDCQPECCEPGCGKHGRSTSKRNKNGVVGPTSFCSKHLHAHLTTNEKVLGPELKEGAGGKRQFVCRACEPRVGQVQHRKGGCATCEETTNFKKDLRACLSSAAPLCSESKRVDLEVCASINKP